MRLKLILLITAVSFAMNGALGYKVFMAAEEEAVLQKCYPYLSKRIFADNPNDVIINFTPLRLALGGYVKSQEQKIGVYFEYLPSGGSISVNGNQEVRLASLSKVPLAMSIFRKIERGKMSLNDILVVKKEHLDDRFGSLWKLGENVRLSVEELIKLCLVESDNTAYNVLYDALTSDEINEVYNALDVRVEGEGDSQTVSPKTYSSIFRSLYLSSFLSKADSNRILDILTETKFNDKLPAGVPSDVKVSHKIGVFKNLDAARDLFVDCGIVFVPNRPYILCLFDQDIDEHAQERISSVSRSVYGYVSSVKGNQ